MKHLRALLIYIGDLFLMCFLWLVARFGELSTYVGLIIIGLCFLLFFPADLLQGALIFGMVIAGVLFINHKRK